MFYIWLNHDNIAPMKRAAFPSGLAASVRCTWERGQRTGAHDKNKNNYPKYCEYCEYVIDRSRLF